MGRNSTPLKDACVLITDGTHYSPPTSVGGCPFLTVKDMQPHGLDLLGCSFVSDTEFDKAKAGGCVPVVGDVLFSKDGTVGKVHVVKESTPFAILSSIAILRPNPKLLDSEYLGYVLRSPITLSQAIKRKTGSALKRIILSDLREVKIPLPQIDEQRRIAAILHKADAIRRKRQAAGKIASSFAQSLFLDLIGDPISNPKKWKMVPLEEVASTTSGGTPNRKVDAYYGGDIPWVKSGELSQGVVTTTEETLTECGLSESSAKVMPVGTVLLAMYGATAGLVAKLGIEAATNQAVCCIRPGKHIHAEYLLHLLRRHSVSLLTKRVGGAQPNLSQDIIRNLKIPIPPMDVQMDFVQKVACVSSLQRHQESALKETGSLFGAIQGESF